MSLALRQLHRFIRLSFKSSLGIELLSSLFGQSNGILRITAGVSVNVRAILCTLIEFCSKKNRWISILTIVEVYVAELSGRIIFYMSTRGGTGVAFIALHLGRYNMS